MTIEQAEHSDAMICLIGAVKSRKDTGLKSRNGILPCMVQFLSESCSCAYLRDQASSARRRFELTMPTAPPFLDTLRLSQSFSVFVLCRGTGSMAPAVAMQDREGTPGIWLRLCAWTNGLCKQARHTFGREPSMLIAIARSSPQALIIESSSWLFQRGVLDVKTQILKHLFHNPC